VLRVALVAEQRVVFVSQFFYGFVDDCSSFDVLVVACFKALAIGFEGLALQVTVFGNRLAIY